jgi:hypothetical protein
VRVGIPETAGDAYRFGFPSHHSMIAHDRRRGGAPADGVIFNSGCCHEWSQFKRENDDLCSAPAGRQFTGGVRYAPDFSAAPRKSGQHVRGDHPDLHRFPRPGPLARLKFALRAHADTLALTAVLLATLYFAGHLARAIEANANAIVCA